MSWLLFMDESGPDPEASPYEVRGGVAIHDSRLWPLVLELQRREQAAFGAELRQFFLELKGSQLLGEEHFQWATQMDPMPDEERRRHCRAFVAKGLEKQAPTGAESAAFGQACLEMASGVFDALKHHEARLLAAVAPAQGLNEAAPAPEQDGHLRKDHVFLFERFFYLLEAEEQHGLIVLDEQRKMNDQRFVARFQSYFRKTDTGRYRASRIVPSPLFASSELIYPAQAAELAMYCINWGFRLPGRGMTAPVRPEIAERFGARIGQLQYHGQGRREGASFETFGIVFVPDVYAVRK